MDQLPATGDSQRLLAILWKQKLVVLGSVIVMLALALIYTVTSAKVYQATAVLQVNVASSQPGTTGATDANAGLAQNYATLIVSPSLLNTIRSQVEGGRLSVDSLQSRLSASALTGSALVQVSAKGPSPAAAERLAAQVVAGFLAQLQSSANARTAQLQTQIQSQLVNFSNQIAALSSQPKTAVVTQEIASLRASRDALNAQLQALVATGIAQGTSASLSAPPVASSSPISPRKSLNLAGGLVLGLVLGIGLAWARQRLRPALQSSDEIAAASGLPVLATIPLRSKLRDDDPIVAEAYRILSTNLSFALRDTQHRIVTVVGHGPQIGKTSVVRGIAEANTSSSRRTLVIDGDLRAATLSKELGYEAHTGIVDVLQGVVDFDEALVPLEKGVWLMPARRAGVNAASLLSGSGLAALCAAARKSFDLVVFDSPPIAGLADGLILASMSDIVIVVARVGVTRGADLTTSVANLRQSFTPIGGIVVFEPVAADPYYPLADAGGASLRERVAELRGSGPPKTPVS